MARQKRKPKIKKILSATALLLAIPISVKLMLMSLPYMNAAASKAALFSAGLAMPEGGKAALDGNIPDTESTSGEISSSQTSSQPAVSSSPQSVLSSVVSALSPFTELTSIPSQIVISDPAIAEKNRGKILRQAYNGGASGDLISLSKGSVRNSTQISTDLVKKELAKGLDFSLKKSAEPQVLIYHTHATESYERATRDYYDKTYNSRSRDDSVNMNMVGDQIEYYIRAAGIGVIHDKTQHDYPSYTGAYDNSMTTIQKYLKQYPTIKVVLDVHRDAIQRSDGTRIAPIAKINGKNAAQIMIIAGAEREGDITHDFYQNLRFAAHLQTQLEGDYPGLTRPISFAYRKYNQSASPGAVLLEFGGHGNSLEEARYAGELAGKAIARALQKMQK